MKVCWPSRSVASTSLSASWRCREGRRRRKRWMRWWPRENGRCLMRICWMTPESHGRNCRRLSSDIRYDELSKTGAVLVVFPALCNVVPHHCQQRIAFFILFSQAKSGYCCVDQELSYFLWSRPFFPIIGAAEPWEQHEGAPWPLHGHFHAGGRTRSLHRPHSDQRGKDTRLRGRN